MRVPEWYAASHAAAAASLAAVAPAVNGEGGIISHVCVEPGAPGEPRVFHAESRLRETVGTFGGIDDRLGVTSGAGLSPDLAVICALGEALERYCYAVREPADVVVGSYNQLRQSSLDAIAPSRFALYSEAQRAQARFPYGPFTDDLVIGWTCGCSLTTGREMWVPEPFVHAPGPPPLPGDLVIAPSTTTGLACARTLEAAILGGVCEVVERDAAMCAWTNRLPCPRVQPVAGSWLSNVLANHFESDAYELCLWNLTSDIGISTVLAALIDSAEDGAAVAMATATRPFFEAAAVKAALEAAQVRRWLQRTSRAAARTHRPDFRDVFELSDHVLLFGSRRSLRYLDFLGNGAPMEDDSSDHDTEDVRAQLRTAIRALAAHALEPVVVDLTRPEVATLGFCVVRVIIPGLIDVNADHNCQLLGGSRLYAAPRVRGYRPNDARPSDLNPIPHPFP